MLQVVEREGIDPTQQSRQNEVQPEQKPEAPQNAEEAQAVVPAARKKKNGPRAHRRRTFKALKPGDDIKIPLLFPGPVLLVRQVICLR